MLPSVSCLQRHFYPNCYSLLWFLLPLVASLLPLAAFRSTNLEMFDFCPGSFPNIVLRLFEPPTFVLRLQVKNCRLKVWLKMLHHAIAKKKRHPQQSWHQEILADVHNKDFANLQLRQALWRTIPLAIVGFFLAARVFLEIPICQMAADLSRLVHIGELQTNKDPLVQDLKRDNIDPRGLYSMDWWQDRSADDTQDPKLARFAEKTLAHVWANCQCSDGRWDKVDKRVDVVTIFPFTDENKITMGELGGLGPEIPSIR